MKLDRKLFNWIALPVFVCILVSTYLYRSAAQARVGEIAVQGNCGIDGAVYRPHREYFERGGKRRHEGQQDFTLHVTKPLSPPEGGSMRNVFFEFRKPTPGMDGRYSAVRLADFCGSGAGQCSVSGYAGQYSDREEMKESALPFNFKPIALDANIFPVPFFGPDAPQFLIFPGTASVIYYARNNRAFTSDIKLFSKFDASSTFPDFSGLDLWVLSSCGQGL